MSTTDILDLVKKVKSEMPAGAFSPVEEKSLVYDQQQGSETFDYSSLTPAARDVLRLAGKIKQGTEGISSGFAKNTGDSQQQPKYDSREQAIIDRNLASFADDKLAGEAAGDMEVQQRRQQRAYAEQAPPEVVAPVKELLSSSGDRAKVLDIVRKMTPEQKEESLRLAAGIAQQMGDDRGGAIGRTLGALSLGVSKGVSQPIMELIGMGGTQEEIDYIRKLDAIAAQEFAPARPGDPWYESGPLQAAQMAPWMATVVGGNVAGTAAGKIGGQLLARGAAAGVPGAKAAFQAAGAVGRAPTLLGRQAMTTRGVLEGAGGLAGITAASFPGQYAQEVDSLKELGMQDDWKLRLLAGGTATVGGLIEGIVPNPFAGSVSLKQGAMKAARQYLWEAIKKAPAELTEEGLQGFTSGLGDYVAQYIASEKDLDFGDGETVKSNGVKKKTIVDAFKKGWEQTKEAALPMAFLLGAPAVGGAGLSAIRARRYQLEQLRAKGFVTKDEAKDNGIEGSTRKEVTLNVNNEIRDLDEQERQAMIQADLEYARQQQVQAPQPQGGVQPEQFAEVPIPEDGGMTDEEYAAFRQAQMAAQGGNVSTSAPTDTATVPPVAPQPTVQPPQVQPQQPAAVPPAAPTVQPQPTPPVAQQTPVVQPTSPETAPLTDKEFAEQKASEQGPVAPQVPVITSPEEHASLPMFGVYETTFQGQKRYGVKSSDKGGFGDSLFGSPQEAQAESDRSFASFKDQERKSEESKKKAEEATKKQADYEASFGGFLSTDPKTKGRQLKVLGSSRQYNGKVVTVKDLIEQKIAGGSVVNASGQLESPDGAYLGSDKITKIGIDYARYLLASRTESETPGKPDSTQSLEFNIGQGARPIPGMESDEANYTVLKRKPDVIPDTFKVVISGRPFGKGWLSVDGTGTTGEEAYRRAFDRYMQKRLGELRDKTRKADIRKAIEEQGGFDANSADDVDAIRRKLYDGADTPTGTEIRAVMDEMKVEAGRKLELEQNAPESEPQPAPQGKTEGFRSLPEKSRSKFEELWNADDTSIKDVLDKTNKNLRAEFEARTGLTLPKTKKGTEETVEKWHAEGRKLADETQPEVSDNKPKPPAGYKPLAEFTPMVTQTLSPDFELEENRNGIKELALKQGEAVGYRVYPKRGSIKGGYWQYGTVRYEPSGSHASIELADGTVESVGGSRLVRLEPVTATPPAEQPSTDKPSEAEPIVQPEGEMSVEDFVSGFVSGFTSGKQEKTEKSKEVSVPASVEQETQYSDIKQHAVGITRTIRAEKGGKMLLLEQERNRFNWSIREIDSKQDIISGISELKRAKAIAERVFAGTFDKDADLRFVLNDPDSLSYSNQRLAGLWDGRTAESFAATLVSTGYYTDGRMLVKLSDKDRDAVLKKAGTQGSGRIANIDAVIARPKKQSNYKDNEMSVVGYRGGERTPRVVMLKNKIGDYVVLDKAYHDTVMKRYPTAKIWGSSEKQNGNVSTPVLYEVDGETVAVISPLTVGKVDKYLSAMIEGKFDATEPPPAQSEAPPKKPKSLKKEPKQGVKEGLDKAKEGAKLFIEGIKDATKGTTPFANIPMNEKIARGLGMMAEGLIEAGKYKFVDFIDSVVELVGIQNTRNYARYLEAGWSEIGETDSRLDKPQSVLGLLEAKEAKEDYGTPEKPDRIALGRHFYEKLKGGASYPRITDARKEASELLGGSPKDGSSAIKDIDESVEIGVVLAARDIAQSGASDEDVYDQLVDLYGRQPNLANRTSTSMKEQAYSTPAPLAFIANRRAGVTSDDTVYDSSAGNGMLLIVGGKRYANELNEDRAESLRSQGVDTHQGDATSYSIDKPIDALVINPPFGTVEDATGKTISWSVEGVRTDKIDHAISMRSLADIPENGKAVIVIAAKGFEKSEPKSDSARGAAYLAEKRFYDHVYDNYNVTDHFTVHGDLYRKQGASFPVDVIVISGKGKSQRPKPYNIVGNGIPEVIRTWEELKDAKLRPVSSVSSTSVSGGKGTDSGSVVAGDATATTKDAERVPAGTPGKRMGTKDGGKPKPQKLGVADGQPGTPGKADGKNAVGGVTPKTERIGAGGGLGDAGRPSGSARRDSLKPDESAETDFQVSYSPGSKNKSVDTLIPRNHQAAVEKSLDAISEVYGDIDEFVAKELGYEMDEFENVFSAEQVDALAMAIARHKDGGAFIIGDQTGVGKGRAAAAMMVYANRNGMVPVFITEKPTLYADMIRDLIDIGRSTEDAPFNLLMTNALSGKDVIPLPDGRVLRQSQDAAKSNLSEAVASVLNGDTLSVEGKPIGRGKKKTAGERVVYNAVFTTYSQLQPVKQMAPERARLLKSISSQSFFILDESHNAGGGSDSDPNANQERRSSGQQATITRAEIVRDLISEAAGLYFSSATYAKRPQTMGLYAKTGMTAATNGDPNALSEAIATGGVPLQQVVSEQLVESGMYLRRERSFDGVEFNPKTVDVDLKNLDNISSIFSAINFFDGFAQEAIQSIADEITSAGGTIAETEATGEAGLESTSFSSILHNLVDQMLLAVKADSVANEAIDSIKNGESPVIYVDSTLEAALKRQVDETGASQGEEIDFSYKDLVRRYLERSREYTTRTNADDPDSVVRIRLTDQQLGEAGVLAYERAMEMIESFSGDMPASPIDWIRKRITDAGYSIGEITGRQVILEYQDDGTVKLGRRSEEEEGSGGRTTTVSRFNSGDLDAVLINQSGSTGISMHASEKFKNQKPRHMIIGQPARNIDTFMQSLGRVHRTGQIVLPRFTLLMTNAPAEIRPASVLMKKLSSLNANVTASAKGSVSFDAPDVINIVGDQVVAEYLADNLELDRHLGELVQLRRDGTPKRNPGIAKKASGRMALRPVSEQKDFWDSVIAFYDELISELNRVGKNPLLASTLDLNAKTIEAVTIFDGDEGSANLFMHPASIETIVANKPGKPMTSEEVQGAVKEFYGEPATDAVVSKWLKDIENEIRTAAEEYLNDVVGRGLSGEELQIAKTRFQVAGNTQFDNLMRRLRSFAPGKSISVYERSSDGAMLEVIPGFVTKVKRLKGGNPLAASKWMVDIAIASPDRIAKTALSRTGQQEVEGGAAGGTYKEFMPNNELFGAARLQDFDEADASTTEVRYVGVGNILAAYSQLGGSGGQVTFFTDTEGKIRRGVLMPRSFRIDRWEEARPVVLDNVDQAHEFLSSGGQLTTPDRVLSLMLVRGELIARAPKAKSKSGKYTINAGILEAASPQEFGSIGNRMEMAIEGKGKQKEVLTAIMQVASLQAVGQDKPLARNIKAAAQVKSQSDLDNGLRNPPETLYQTEPDIYAGFRSQAMNLGLAAEKAGITEFNDFVAHSVKTIGTDDTYKLGAYLRRVGEIVGMTGIRPVKDILGVPMTQEEYVQLGKQAFAGSPQVTPEQVEAGIEAAMLTGLPQMSVGFSPAGSPVPRQGLMQANVKTDTPAFKKWFGDSKVVDKDGKPLVVYHGTGTSVSVLEPRPDVLEDQFGARALDSLEGVFFTDNVDDAANYAKVSPDGPQLMPVYLSIINPANIYRPRGTKEIARRLQEAKKAGMDGAIIEHETYTHYVAFESNQIKSAIANVGTFDPNNPNMLMQKENKTRVTPWRNGYKLVRKVGNGEITFFADVEDLYLDGNYTLSWAMQAEEDTPKGTGAATSMLLELLDLAKRKRIRGVPVSYQSEGIIMLSEASVNLHLRLMEAGVPFVYDEEEHAYVMSSEALASLDIDAIRNQLAVNYASRNGDSDTNVLKQEENPRIGMSYKDANKRVAALTEAAKMLKDGSITKDQYAEIVDRNKTVTPYDFVPEPATYEDAKRALPEGKIDKFGKTSTEIPSGYKVKLRLDIPSFTRAGVWINTIHRTVNGKAETEYDAYSSVTNASFEQTPGEQKSAFSVATGEKPKGPFATIRGNWQPMTKDEAVAKAKAALKSDEWIQVGYDPERHSYFYDRSDTRKVLSSADEVIQIGPLVLAKNPVYGSRENVIFQGLDDSSRGNVKGWTKFISGTRALIGATSKADISTVIHEFAHPIRRFLLDRNVPQDQRLDITDAEIEMLEKKCGAGSVIDGKWVTKWDVPAEEKFAKMWEQYFFEGESPNTLLDSLFEKISRWMQQVYKTAMDITGGTLDPEVRKLFDKLVQRQLPADQRTDTRSRDGGKGKPPIYLPVTSDQWGDNLTSLANAAANDTRERLSLPSLTEPASEGFQEWLDEAVVRMRKDPTLGNRLVKELQQSTRNISNIEVAVLNLHYRHLKNLSDAAAKRLFAAIDDKLGDVAIVEARRESDALINEIEDFTDMTKKVGTEAGRALVARKIALAEDYTLGNLLLKARVANAGQPLSESQLQEMRELADKIAKLEGDLAKEIQEKDDLARQLAVKESIDDTQKQVGKPVRNTATNRAVKKVESFVSKFVNIFGKRDDTTTLQQTEDEQMAEDGEEVIKSFVEAGVYSFGEFMSKFKTVIKGDVPVAARVALRKAWDKMKAQGDIPAPDMSDERQTAELRRLAKMVERNLVEFGITDPEEVIDGVHEALQEVFEDVTRREAMDAMSGYGQYSTPSQERNDKIIRDLNAQFQQMAKLDDMQQGIAPKKSGRGRDEPSPELRELIREVNEMKRNSKYFVTDPEAQLKTIFQATRTALSNRIYDLDKALNVTKEPIPGRTPNTFEGEQAEEIESLRKQRDELMAAYKATFPKPGLTFEQRAAIAERAIDRAITEIESQLATGDIAPKRRAEPISTPTLEAKRMRLEALRATREAAREMQKPKLTEEEIADREKRRAEKAYVANLLNRIADYEDRKRQGYFGPKPKKEPRDLSPREIELSRQLVNLKDEFFRYAAEYRLKNMSKVERFWDRTKETMHLSRAIMTSFDLSAVFRQGGIASLAHPRLAAAASREMLAALRRGDAEFDTMDKISKDELYALAMRAGLSITTDSGKITRQEEAYMGRWAKWGIGKKGTKINELSLKALFFVAPSARSYTTFLNSMRFRVFKYMVSNLGAGGEVTIDEARVIASYVNAATGRAELGKFNQAAANLNTVFFAPRYVASRFQYLAMPFYLLPSTKVSGRVKKMIAMEYARHAMGLAAFLGLSVALASLLTDDEEEKPTVEFDPRSSDFMKLKIGDTRIDPMAGLSQTVTLIGQMTTGQKKGLRGDIKDLYGENRKFGDPDLWDVGTGFLRKKLAPIPGAIVDLRVGENVIGEKETVLSATTDLFVPLSFQEAGETMKARGLVGGSVVTALSLLGMGGGTYGPKTQYATADAAKREELFKKDLENVKWNDPDLAYKDFLTTAQVDKFNKQREGRKQSLVFSAAADPKRKDYNSDETYKKSVEERDKALDAVIKAGMGPKEVQLLLIAYYKRNYGSAYETRGGVYQMKESLANRLRAIRRKLNEQK